MAPLSGAQLRDRVTLGSPPDIAAHAAQAPAEAFAALVCDGYACTAVAWSPGDALDRVRVLALERGWSTNGETYDWCRACTEFRLALAIPRTLA